MHFIRIAAILLLVLCLVDVAQDCATSAALNLTDDDHHDVSALISPSTFVTESYQLVPSFKARFALLCLAQSMYRPIRQ